MKIYHMNEKTWMEIASYMNDEPRETVNYELAPCSKQKFLDRYLELDPDFETLLMENFDYCFRK